MKISPVTKYTLGRVGLFIVCVAALIPLPLYLPVKLMIAIVVSFGLQLVLLRKWRAEMIGQVDASFSRRREERAKLRSALAGEDDDTPN